MSGMSHGWIGARALMNRRRSQKGRASTGRDPNPGPPAPGGAHGGAAGGPGGTGSHPGSASTSPTSPTQPTKKEGYQPLDISIKVTRPDSAGSPEERAGGAKKKGQDLRTAVEEIFAETSRLAERFLSRTPDASPGPCADATSPGGVTSYQLAPSSAERHDAASRRASTASLLPDPGVSVSRRGSYSHRFDPDSEREWRELQDDLSVFAKMREVNLHGEWLSDNYGIGSYRYIHYTGYAPDRKNYDKLTKVLDGTIESIFTSTCCCCCVGCSPVAVRIFIKDANQDDVMTVKLTGDVTKFPMDTAHLETPAGKVFATIKWKKRTFYVKGTDGHTMFRLKLNKWWPCNLQWKHMILSGDGKHTIGWITAKNASFGTEWSAGKILTTSVPRALDVRQKAAWVSLLFLMKLYNRGKEYAKVQLHDED